MKALVVLAVLAMGACGETAGPDITVVADFTGTYAGTSLGSENGVSFAGRALVFVLSQGTNDSLAGAWTFADWTGTLAARLESDSVATIRLTQIVPCTGELRGSIQGAYDAETGEVQLIYGQFGGGSCLGTPNAKTVFAEFVLPRQ